MNAQPNPPVRRVLEKLNGVKPTAGGWVARCPAHDDTHPSLSINNGNNGKAVVNCHAGCETEAVMKAVSMTMADLFDDSTTKKPPARAIQSKIECTYDYRDEDGKIVFQVVRKKPKGFYQRRPSGNGQWIDNVKGVRRILYHLPEIGKCGPDDRIFVVEGEQDADRLAALGIVATTSPGGAGKWDLVDHSILHDRPIAILPDNDEAGEKHAQHVADRLARFCADVRIVKLPGLERGGDVSDWLSNGGTKDGLLRLVQKAAPHRLDEDDTGTVVHPYRESDGRIVWLKPTKDGATVVPLTNFTARISEEILLDDGVETRRAYTIEVRLSGRLQRLSIPASQFGAMNWPSEHLGARAVVSAGFGSKDRAREAIQLLSPAPRERRRFVHTGWRHKDGESIFLHGGGAIGADGVVSDIEVELPGALEGVCLPAPPASDRLRTVVAASLEVLDLAPDSVTVPAFAAIWRAVLGPSDISLHYCGQSGVAKTALVAVVQQHYGATLDQRNLPASWLSTGNALEMTLFAAKDVLIVIDDFAAAGGPRDIDRHHREADRVFRAQGNRAGRLRMRADTSLRAARPPRGMVLSTGEVIPRGQSLRARVLVVEVAKSDIDWEHLTAVQHNASIGLYAEALAAFLRWLAPQMQEMPARLRARIEELRSEFLTGGHRRTPEIVANLVFGMEVFCEFARAVDALRPEDATALMARCRAALLEVAAGQARFQAASDPARRFVELATAAIAAGRAHVAGRDGKAPSQAGAWGWRALAAEESVQWQPSGERIGWVEGPDLYLEPDASLAVVQRLARDQGESLAVTGRTLHKRLHEAGVLKSVEETRGTLTVRRSLGEKRRNVLHLHAEALSAGESVEVDRDPST